MRFFPLVLVSYAALQCCSATSAPNYLWLQQDLSTSACSDIQTQDLYASGVSYSADSSGDVVKVTCGGTTSSSSWTYQLNGQTADTGTGTGCVALDSTFSVLVDCSGGPYNNAASHSAIDTSAFVVQVG